MVTIIRPFESYFGGTTLPDDPAFQISVNGDLPPVAIVSGAIQMGGRAPTGGGSPYRSILYQSGFLDMVQSGGSITVELDLSLSDPNGQFSMVLAGYPQPNSDYPNRAHSVGVLIEGGNLTFSWQGDAILGAALGVDGENAINADAQNISPYNPYTQRWLRLIHDGTASSGDQYWFVQTSPDGLDWTTPVGYVPGSEIHNHVLGHDYDRDLIVEPARSRMPLHVSPCTWNALYQTSSTVLSYARLPVFFVTAVDHGPHWPFAVAYGGAWHYCRPKVATTYDGSSDWWDSYSHTKL